MITNEQATIDQIFKKILDLINPQANLYDTMWGIQNEGRKPGESMEALASRVKVARMQVPSRLPGRCLHQCHPRQGTQYETEGRKTSKLR